MRKKTEKTFIAKKSEFGKPDVSSKMRGKALQIRRTEMTRMREEEEGRGWGGERKEMRSREEERWRWDGESAHPTWRCPEPTHQHHHWCCLSSSKFQAKDEAKLLWEWFRWLNERKRKSVCACERENISYQRLFVVPNWLTWPNQSQWVSPFPMCWS